MRFGTFALVCAGGRLPGTILLGAGGSAIFKENWYALVTICVVCGALFLAAYLKKETIREWFHHWTGAD